MSRLTKSDYQFAIDSQSACNVSGLINTLARLLPLIWEEIREGSEFTKQFGINHPDKHPIVRMMVFQIAYLTGLTSGANEPETWNYSEISLICSDRAESKHIWHKCKEEKCLICEGELKDCVVCGLAEGQLTEKCCGYLVTEGENPNEAQSINERA